MDSIIHGKQARKAQIELFLAEQDKLENITEFHEDTWYALLGYVTVYDKEDIRFTFKDGIEIQVKKRIGGRGYFPCCLGRGLRWWGIFLFVDAGVK